MFVDMNKEGELSRTRKTLLQRAKDAYNWVDRKTLDFERKMVDFQKAKFGYTENDYYITGVAPGWYPIRIYKMSAKERADTVPPKDNSTIFNKPPDKTT